MKRLSCLLVIMILIFTGCGSVDIDNKDTADSTGDTTKSDGTKEKSVHVDKTYTAYFVVDGNRKEAHFLKNREVMDKTTSVHIDADFIDERDTVPSDSESPKGRFYGNMVVNGMETEHSILADVGGGVTEAIYLQPFDDTGEYFVVNYTDYLIDITGDSYKHSDDVVNQYSYQMIFKKDSLEEFFLYVWYFEYDENGEQREDCSSVYSVLVCAQNKENAQKFYDEYMENVVYAEREY